MAEVVTGASSALPRATAVIRDGIRERLHIGAQVYVSVRGAAVADFGIGEARPGVPMTPETIMLWLSATKPVAAIAIGQLWEQELLELDDPVARHLPEFGANGKDAVTLRHLLTHTGGFRGVAALWSSQPWDDILAHICQSPLEAGWRPGGRAGYHVASSWFVLGEIVRRLDGRTFDIYVRDEIFEPLGMWDSWIGMPPARYRAYGDRIGIMHRTDGPVPHPQIYDTEQRCAVCRPAGNGHGPMRQLGRFYEALLFRGERGGRRILRTETVEALTARHRTGMYDETFRHVMDWGLGFMVDSKQYGVETVPYGYGPYASPRTFGHGGAQSSVGFCDPERGLAAAIVFNGMPGEAAHNRRIRAVLAALYEDVGLI